MYLNETCREEGNALRIGEKKEKDNPITFNLQAQNKDVLYNPENPVNPDSKPRLQAPQASNTYPPTSVRSLNP